MFVTGGLLWQNLILRFLIPCGEVGGCCMIEIDYRFCLRGWSEVALCLSNELLLFMCTCLESLASAHARTKPPIRRALAYASRTGEIGCRDTNGMLYNGFFTSSKH